MDALQEKFINVVARTGSPRLALDELKISFIAYQQWTKNQDFKQLIKSAEEFYINGINEAIVNASKQALYLSLKNGVVEKKQVQKKVFDSEGNPVATEISETKMHKGVPASYIGLGLSLQSNFDRAIEEFLNRNIINIDQAEALREAYLETDMKAQKVLTGKTDRKSITDEDIAELQSIILGE